MFLFKLDRAQPVKVTTPEGDVITFKVFSNKGKNKYQVGIEAPTSHKIERPHNGKANKNETQTVPTHNHARSTDGSK